MSADKLQAFARKKADDALGCFQRGDAVSGLPKARAAMDLFARTSAADPGLIGPLCKGMVEALASQWLFCEASEMLCARYAAIADHNVGEALLKNWLLAVNRPVPGDLVQLSTTTIGVVVAPCLPEQQCGDMETPDNAPPKRWRVQLRGVDATCDPHTLAVAAANVEGEEVEVDAVELTLLSLRLQEEQRERWVQILEACPELFGQRMRPENEKRWQKLFGGCASRLGGVVGAGAVSGEADLGLPLEQSFVATLHSVITDYIKLMKPTGDCADDEAVVEKENGIELIVDVLGCRPALELESPEVQLAALFASSSVAGTVRTLNVRMCGPEVGCEAWRCEKDLDCGSKLIIDVRPGLYHDVFPQCGADVVIAFNAGIGVPQYSRSWAPTLELLRKQPKRLLFAVTAYSPGELLREFHLLRRRYAKQLNVRDVGQLHKLTAGLRGPAPWSLLQDIELQDPSSNGGVHILRRGDVVEPAQTNLRAYLPVKSNGNGAIARIPLSRDDLLVATAQLANGPWCFKVLRSNDLLYVGPNPTPGRSRNYGKLLMWVGGDGHLP